MRGTTFHALVYPAARPVQEDFPFSSSLVSFWVSYKEESREISAESVPRPTVLWSTYGSTWQETDDKADVEPTTDDSLFPVAQQLYGLIGNGSLMPPLPICGDFSCKSASSAQQSTPLIMHH
jgi:hypothetical protein